MNKKRWVLLLLSLIVVLSIIGCKKTEMQVEKEVTKSVKVMTIEEEKKPIKLSYLGHVNVMDTQKNAFLTGGTLKTLNVSEGDIVKKGDLLATLDESTVLKDKEVLETNYINALNILDEAKKSYDFVKDDYNRKEKLYNGGALSEVLFDSVIFKLEQARIGYEKAKNNVISVKKQYEKVENQIAEFQVESEIAGVVVAITASVGEKIQPMNPIIIISSENKEVVTGVVRDDLSKISIGDSVSVKYDDEILNGNIYYIGTKLNILTKTYPIKIALEDETEDLIDQSLVNVKFVVGEEKGFWIPINSINTEIEDYVFVYFDGVAEKRKINLIKTDGENVKVDGLMIGDKLVIQGMSNLRNGDLIEMEKGE